MIFIDSNNLYSQVVVEKDIKLYENTHLILADYTKSRKISTLLQRYD